MDSGIKLSRIDLFRCTYRRTKGEAKAKRVVTFTGGWDPTAKNNGAHECVYTNPNLIQLVKTSEKWTDAHVYSALLTDEQAKKWPKQPQIRYIVAMSEAAARSFCEKHFGRIADNHLGMAQEAIGDLMMKVSSKPPTHTRGVTRKAKKTAYKETFVVERTVGDGFILDMRDNLNFAKLALKSPDAINIALKKAANKVAGMIQHKCKGAFKPGDMETPFPEVKRRRKA